MRKFQIYLLLIIVGIFMIALETGLPHSWNWPKIDINNPASDNNIHKINNKIIYSTINIQSNNYLDILSFSHLNESNRWNKSSLIFQNYSFISPFNPLRILPRNDQSKTNVTYTLLITYFRAGSSFLGDLLQQNWRSFYSFEPLHYMTDGMKIDNSRENEAIMLIKNIFECKFSNIPDYIHWAEMPLNRFLFRWNKFLWNLCIFRKSCFDSTFLHEICSISTNHIIKSTRLYLKNLKSLLKILPASIDLKIVYLVRDPRAILNSRKGLSWCKRKCLDAQTLCDEMSADITIFRQLRDKYPNKLFHIRYEDLSLNSFTESRLLFKKLNIPFTSSVHHFIRVHTASKKSPDKAWNPYSTRRDSKSIPFQWVNSLKTYEISWIQDVCSSVMRQLGYKLLNVTLINNKTNESSDILEPHFVF